MPQPVRRRGMTLARLSLTASPVEFLQGRDAAFQGTGGRVPGLPQRTSPFSERLENVERIVEIGKAGSASAGALELYPFTQPGTVVPDHRLERRESGEFLRPCDAVARLDHPPCQPAEALGLDDHQDGSSAKKIPTGRQSVRESGGFERGEIEGHAWQHHRANGGRHHAYPPAASGYGHHRDRQDPRGPPDRSGPRRPRTAPTT